MNADTADPEVTTPDAGGPDADRLLELTWRYHRQWSRAAEAAKKRLDRWRIGNLVLLILGALAGAAAATDWGARGARERSRSSRRSLSPSPGSSRRTP